MEDLEVTVDELIAKLKKLSMEGKGDYIVTCNGFCEGVSNSIRIDDLGRQISL